VRLQFHLTNQDSAEGKTVLSLRQVLVNMKDIAVGQPFSIKTALDICEKGFLMQKS